MRAILLPSVVLLLLTACRANDSDGPEVGTRRAAVTATSQPVWTTYQPPDAAVPPSAEGPPLATQPPSAATLDRVARLRVALAAKEKEWAAQGLPESEVVRVRGELITSMLGDK
jgi:hypothetical protein